MTLRRPLASQSLPSSPEGEEEEGEEEVAAEAETEGRQTADRGGVVNGGDLCHIIGRRHAR